MGVLSKKRRPRRPPLRKRTAEESARFRQEYSEKMLSFSRSTGAYMANTLESIAGNGLPKACKSLHRFRPTLSDEQNERERLAAAEAAKKAKQIMPLYPKGAYQLITEGNKQALIDDSRGKRHDQFSY